MNSELSRIAQRAEELRQSFDRSFAQEPHVQITRHEDFLAIRVAANPYAIRLAEISGLFVDKLVTPLPGSVRELLGVAAFRGAIVPVYDLRAMLGYTGGSPPRWLALVSAPSPVSLAFDKFEGHLRAPRDAMATQEPGEVQRQHIRGIVRVAEATLPVVHLPSILEAIVTLARPTGPQKER